MGKQLANKPLIEALLELKWGLLELGPGALQDPVYPLFIGRFAEQLKATYPHIEALPAVQIPDEITGHIVKYRFRKQPGGYPLVQAGPGVASINFNEHYDWDSFLPAATDFYDRLVSAYGSCPNLSSILLRYINAVEVDIDKQNVIDFVSAKLHTSLALPKEITESEVIDGLPQGLMLTVPYRINSPKSIAILRIASGQKHDKPAVVWEVNIQSLPESVPQTKTEFSNWLIAAHDVVEHWFFTLIAGDLEKMFGDKTPCKP